MKLYVLSKKKNCKIFLLRTNCKISFLGKIKISFLGKIKISFLGKDLNSRKKSKKKI